MVEIENFKNDKVLTASEVGRLIEHGLGLGEIVALRIGDRERKIVFIGHLDVEGVPLSNRWRIEVE